MDRLKKKGLLFCFVFLSFGLSLFFLERYVWIPVGGIHSQNKRPHTNAGRHYYTVYTHRHTLVQTQMHMQHSIHNQHYLLFL